MVKYGQFSLGLIRAETGASYKEHSAPCCKDIYAEVEPDDEFYLQLRSDAPEVVYVDLTVDGTLIQRGHRAYPGQTSRVGVIRVDGVTAERTATEVALKFERAKVAAAGVVGGGANGACEYWTGQVEATFYGNPTYCIHPGATPIPSNESADHSGANIPSSSIAAPPPAVAAPVRSNVIYREPRNTYYRNPRLASSDVGYVPGKTAETQKKGVKSAEGKTALRTHNLDWCNRPSKQNKNKHCDPHASLKKEPEKLGVLTLKYCTTLGLIYAGILDKPPNWDAERLKMMCTKRMRDEHERILSQIKIQKFDLNTETINGQGEKVVEKRVVELFDLTEL